MPEWRRHQTIRHGRHFADIQRGAGSVIEVVPGEIGRHGASLAPGENPRAVRPDGDAETLWWRQVANNFQGLFGGISQRLGAAAELVEAGKLQEDGFPNQIGIEFVPEHGGIATSKLRDPCPVDFALIA